MVVKRTKRLPVLLTPDEWAMLQALADKQGVTASDVLRLNLRRAYAEAFGSDPPKKPRKR
jgi:hypothetical protein